MKGKWLGFAAACAVLAAWGVTVQADPPPLTLWSQQIGTSEQDGAIGIAVGAAGNIYITGYTEGDLGGPNQGGYDAFVVKCNSDGAVQWTRQIGTSAGDCGTGIAVDGNGNSYITGWTSGDLGGPYQGGLTDAFVVKYDSGGTVQWSRQIGTSSSEEAYGIAVDGTGNIYITGETWGNLGGPNQGVSDAFVVKYDSGGTVQWTRQIGSSSYDDAYGIAVDGSGNSYITGSTYGDLGGLNQGWRDAFDVKYDNGGTQQWARQVGTAADDRAYGIALDGSGNRYITGWTEGDLGGPNQGYRDAFIVKSDSGGTVQWTRQTGSSSLDEAHGIAVDGSGNSYVTGFTSGDLGGPDQGGQDALVVKYDSGGTAQWTRQIGTISPVRAYGIAVDGSGNSYITGYTFGDLGGPNQGYSDAFIVAISTTPAGPGDSNVDGCTDGLDYVIWSSNYDPLTGGKAWWQGDSNGDGLVDGLDYVVWSSNCLQGCPGSPGAIPEPGTALLLSLGALILARRR